MTTAPIFFDLGSAPAAAVAMVQVLDTSIVELERQLAIQRAARDACNAVAALPVVAEDFRPKHAKGAEVLKTAIGNVEGSVK